jgi:hypothetical protein
MPRRRLLLLALPVALVLLGGAAWGFLPDPDPDAVLIERAKQIKAGMTLAAVETLFEGRADAVLHAEHDHYIQRNWLAPDGTTAIVHFDDGGLTYGPALISRHLTMIERIRNRFGLW